MIPEEDKGSMSGIEIVGLLASAGQLVSYSIKITTSLNEIYQRVQDAPKRISQHSIQIKQLISTTKLIQQQQLLQTALVFTHINATLEQAKSLCTILEQLTQDYSRGSIRRYWKILTATKEKEILANLDRLEKEKSALILCISVAQTDILGRGIQKLEMAEREARQHATVTEEGEKVSSPPWMFCQHYRSSESPLGNVRRHTRNLLLTSLQEDDPVYTNNNAGNEVQIVPPSHEFNGTYVDDDHAQREQGDTYQSQDSCCHNFADAGK